MSETWLNMTAADLGRGIEAGEIDAVALTDTFLAAIEAHPYSTRIYATVTADRARSEAAAAKARAEAGTRLSPLDGVPISWKDLFDSAGTVTAAGCQALSHVVPETDAVLLQRATAAGLVCLGKTHMSELAFSGLGYNPKTETPPNIHDPDLIPGGSSSGAAASVAYGLAALGMGSDTGGSVRVPSAWNDLVGLKTGVTFEGQEDVKVLPDDGMVALCKSFDTAGPLCRSVEDATLMFQILGGSIEADDPPAQPRLAVLETVAMDELDPAIADAFERAIERLLAAGYQIDRERFFQMDAALETSPILFPFEAWGEWGAFTQEHGDQMFTPIVERIAGGDGITGDTYTDAWLRLRAVRAIWSAQFDGYDGVICPTTPILAPRIKDIGNSGAGADGGEYYVTQNLAALRNTRIGNLMGLSGLALPTDTPMASFLLNTPGGQEAQLLALGVEVEKIVRGG